jgi:molybdenum-dependent DNA-binding transcriptional regulator ModE
MHHRIKAAAAAQGLSVKRWMTLAAEARLQGQKRVSDKRGPRNELERELFHRLRENLAALRAARRALNKIFKPINNNSRNPNSAGKGPA